MDHFSLSEARAVAVSRQRLGGAGSYESVLRAAGCIQLDTISAVRRAHESSLLARGVPVSEVENSLIARSRPVAFEYWAHALSLIDIELWPYFAFRRRSYRALEREVPGGESAVRDLRVLLGEHGSIDAGHLPEGATHRRAPGSTGWDPRSDHKRALDYLLNIGEVTCVERDGFRRVYRSAADAVPAGLFRDASDDECVDRLVSVALANLGVATVDDVADYFRIKQARVRASLERMEVPRVAVESWDKAAYRDPGLTDVPEVDASPTALSMFDTLVWHRGRLERLWGHDWRIEIYVPQKKRTFGYWCMPVVVGSEIPGRLALRRRDGRLSVEAAEWAWSDREPLREALRGVAEWTGAKPKWECRVRRLRR